MKSKIKLFFGRDPEFQYDSFIFNGGEVYVNLSNLPSKGRGQDVLICAYITDSDGIMELAMLKDAVDRTMDKPVVRLYMPYIPYARQDRVCNRGEAFSLGVFANILNGMNFDTVSVSDPHSDVATALINNVVVNDQSFYFKNFVDSIYHREYIICAPDGGAIKKAFKVAEAVGKRMITAEKIRDTETGAIVRTVVNCDDLDGRVVWIVDDLCDAGMTFIKLAEALKEKGAGQVNLYVTHGLFSKGKEALHDAGIDNVFAAFDWTDWDNLI